MGNGFLSCKGSNPLCCGTSHYEINNNLYGNYGEMKLNKEKKIITNIFIPNCELKISQDGMVDKSNIENQNNALNLKKENYKKEENIEKNDSSNIQDNLNKYFNEAIKRSSEKNIPLIDTSPSLSTDFTQKGKKIVFNNYNNEFLEYINKLRATPNLIIDDIDYIMKNNIKKVDGKDCIVSKQTNEIIRINENYINFDSIKEFLKNKQPVNILKVNNNLKFKYVQENIEITDKVINEIVLEKRREIINEYPKCFFYPIFIKDIKFTIIVLLSNNIIREKLFYDRFSSFYVTTFNIKNNRFFAILCFA